MATGKPAQIMRALFDHAALLETTGPLLKISWPEPKDTFERPASGKYLEVNLFPNVPAWQAVGAGRMDQGLLQIDVVWPLSQGIVAPAQVVAQVIDHFAKGTRLFNGTTAVKVYADPYPGQHLSEADRVRIPVTIPWRA